MKIELRGISKRYGSVEALKDVSLTVEQGQFLTLLGPTGCGKSTLLRIVAGFVQPDAGEVRIDGEVINDVAPNRRQVGLLFQNYALFPHMTVEENVGFGLRVRGVKKAEAAERVRQMLALLAIEPLRERYPVQLSGGQQQRTALARTLAIEPRVLLLDEPLAALDRKLKLEMQVELRRLVERVGITTICVSHDQDEALTMSDRIALLDAGEVAQFGAPLELYDRPRSRFAAAFLGNSNLLPGVVAREADGQCGFQCDGFCLLLGADVEAGAATLLLRPEHLVLSETPGAQAYAVEVLFATHFGHSVQYEVRLVNGPVLLVSAPRGRGMTALGSGATAYVSLVNADAYQILRGDA